MRKILLIPFLLSDFLEWNKLEGLKQNKPLNVSTSYARGINIRSSISVFFKEELMIRKLTPVRSDYFYMMHGEELY